MSRDRDEEQRRVRQDQLREKQEQERQRYEKAKGELNWSNTQKCRKCGTCFPRGETCPNCG